MADEERDVTTKPVTDEIATTEKDIDIFAGWLTRLENPDPVLRTESAGQGLKLYDEVDRDPHAGAVLQSRRLAVISKEWEVLPGGEDARAVAVADFVRAALKGMNFDQARDELLNAVLYGFYAGEVMWTVRKGAWVPERIRAKHPRRFVFSTGRELRLLTPENMIDGEPVPPRKFIVFTYGSSDNPYGKGLGQKLWWPVWFKKNGIKFWVIFCEKFASPTPVGKYPPGTPKEQQQALLDAMDAIQNETGVKIPDTMQIGLLEAQRYGTVNTYETLCEFMDKQISKAVLGQTATTEGTPGKLGNEKSQEETKQDIVKADADLLCECLNNSLVRWIVDLNFADVTSYPKVWVRCEPEEDLKALSERDKTLVKDIGLPVGRRYFYETYAIPEPADGEELVTPSKEPSKETPKEPGKAGEAFAEAGTEREDEGPGETLDALGGNLMEAADLGPFMQPVEELLGRASTLEEFRDGLIELYADMDDAELAGLMQRAFTVADLAGRYDAAER